MARPSWLISLEVLGGAVVFQELLYRMGTRPARLTLRGAVPTAEEPSCEDPYGIGGIQTYYLPLRGLAAPPAAGSTRSMRR
jgi:hypothetical protein